MTMDPKDIATYYGFGAVIGGTYGVFSGKKGKELVKPTLMGAGVVGTTLIILAQIAEEEEQKPIRANQPAGKGWQEIEDIWMKENSGEAYVEAGQPIPVPKPVAKLFQAAPESKFPVRLNANSPIGIDVAPANENIVGED
jgi:hypothetical protein